MIKITTNHLCSVLALGVLAVASQAQAQSYVTCPQTAKLVQIVDPAQNKHVVDLGKLNPVIQPALAQGDLIELATLAPLSDATRASFKSYAGSFANTRFSDLFFSRTAHGLYYYYTFIPLDNGLSPYNPLGLELVERGCASSRPEDYFAISNEVTFFEPLDPPNTVPPAFDIDAVASQPTVIDVSWSQAPYANIYNETGFEVEVRSFSPAFPTTVLRVGQDETHASVTGLAAGMLYEIGVYALDQTGQRVISAWTNFPRVSTKKFGAYGTVNITNMVGKQNPLCSFSTITQIDGLIDDGIRGRIDNAPRTNGEDVDFPRHVVERPSAPRGYEVVLGNRYAVDATSGTQANAVIFIPSLFSCGTYSGPRFIALHVSIVGRNVYVKEALAGTAYARWGETQGVVLSNIESNGLSELVFDPNKRTISGNFSTYVEFTEPTQAGPVQYGANIELEIKDTELRSDVDY